MKCPRCFALNCATDDYCIGCHAPLAPVRKAIETQRIKASTPQWGYFFVALCGAIPVVTLGGAIPAILGIGGACLCLTVSRAQSVPRWIRFMFCLSITIVAWLILITIIVELMPEAKKRFYDMFQ
jgi:heme O synthase-like polyprenyltransferase